MGSRIGDAIGTFYDGNGVAKVLGLDAEGVVAARQAGSLVGAKTSDGLWIYPMVQFHNGQVNPALTPAIRALRNAPNWSTALWLVTPNPDLDGMSAVEWVEAGGAADLVTLSAKHTAADWR